MFISEPLVYLQLPKTGCTHIASLLQNTIGGQQVGIHNRLPANMVRTGKLIVGSIKNPWDWYISLWAYGCDNKGVLKNNLTRRSFSRPFIRLTQSPFKAAIKIQNELIKPIQTWRETYTDVSEPKLFRKWLRLIFDPERKYDLGEDFGFSSIGSFAGFFTYRYIRLFARDISRIDSHSYVTNMEELKEFDRKQISLDFVIRTECLEEDFIRVLCSAGYHLTEEQLRNIRTAKRRNASNHQETKFYYDTETVDLVAKKEKFLIEKYNYKPPWLQ